MAFLDFWHKILVTLGFRKANNTNMTEEQQTAEPKEEYGNLNDFVINMDKSIPLQVEVAIEEDGRVILFHNKPFKYQLSWFEFDTSSNQLDFVIEDGNIRDFGLPLDSSVAKHMHNAHQILTVEVNQESGEASRGAYIPLIIHGK